MAYTYDEKDNRYNFPVLFSPSKSGGVLYARISVKEGMIYTSRGFLNGKNIVNTPIQCKGKNRGKSNETTDNDQALLEALSRYNKKVSSGYSPKDTPFPVKKGVSPMLAKPYTSQLKTLKFPCAVSWKLDGCRCIAMSTDTGVTLTSRGDKSFNFLDKIREHVSKIIGSDIIDGELYSHNLPFRSIVSIVRQKNNPHSEENRLEYWIYDICDSGDTPYISRMDRLKEKESLYNKTYPKESERVLRFVYYEVANGDGGVKKYHDEYVKRGFEGAIIRVLDGRYQFCRSSNLLKYKKFTDVEFKVVDTFEGRGNEVGAIMFTCETEKGERFNVRPRGSIDVRRQQYKDRDSHIGKFLTVRFQCEEDAYTHTSVPRFGVGIEFRDYE